MIQSLRLIHMADNWLNVQHIRDTCRRVGLETGGKAIDVGCGPLGALHVLQEIVGPTGVVVGLDDKEEALQVARGTLRRRGLDQVMLHQADINQLDAGQLCPPGPFDVAFCRFLLVNQEDPARTLSRMASVVRPGGHIIAHELLDDPSYPVFDPPVPAFGRVMELLTEAMRRKDKRTDAARHFADFARAAGLTPRSQQGFFSANPEDAPAFILSDGLGMLMSIEEAVLYYGLATASEIEHIAQQLQDASVVKYESFFGWILVESIAEVPLQAGYTAV